MDKISSFPCVLAVKRCETTWQFLARMFETIQGLLSIREEAQKDPHSSLSQGVNGLFP